MADEAGEDECTRLIEECLAAAKRLLEEEGQFRPFALTVADFADSCAAEWSYEIASVTFAMKSSVMSSIAR